MTDIARCAVILLAAGRSQRFGDRDKLIAPYGERPLVDHSAELIGRLPFGQKIAVVRSGTPKLPSILKSRGFSIVENDRPDAGLSRSIGLGIQCAGAAEAALIVLADMPHIPGEHFERLCGALSPATPIVASLGEHGPMVPAAFMGSEFSKLLQLRGDAGARMLLAGARTVAIDPILLLDIDLPGQMAD
jgi:molybdenum cofactor cytidylyltransferase